MSYAAEYGVGCFYESVVRGDYGCEGTRSGIYAPGISGLGGEGSLTGDFKSPSIRSGGWRWAMVCGGVPLRAAEEQFEVVRSMSTSMSSP